ncbi:MAG: translocation/assembly module TamB domain-containing protein [Shimia sp.]
MDATASVSTGGTVLLTGPVTLSAPFEANLAAQIAELTLADPGLYQTLANGEVTLRGPLRGGARIAGDLALEETQLRIPNGASADTEALPGLAHVNEPADVRRTRIRAGLAEEGGGDSGVGPAYPLDVTIRAPARIFVRGRGLDAELGGQVTLGGTTRDVQPRGQFELIRGRLDLLGARLDLTDGGITLRGSFDPALRLVAETVQDDVLVRVILEGLASAPEVRLESSPDLPQDEILARLLFGRDLTQISALQALRLAQAVRTLLGQGGDGIVANLRDGFGLDDLDITTDEGGATNVRVGKYISENVYTDLSVNSEGESEVTLNLDITPSITGRGTLQSDGETSLGIFFERDY